MAGAGNASPEQSSAKGWLPAVLAVVLLSELVVLLTLLVPLFDAAGAADGGRSANLTYLGWTVGLSPASAFILLSLTGGAIGGTLHGVASLTAHVADENFNPHWTMWYLANPLVGAALAAVVMFVLQAGLGGQATTTASAGLYGVVAFATLSGLFSRQALDKLKDIFDVAFSTSANTRDNARPREPVNSTVEPPTVIDPGSDVDVGASIDGSGPGPKVAVDRPSVESPSAGSPVDPDDSIRSDPE